MFLAGAAPITFIGDSHTLAYADLVFRDAANELFVTRSHYCRGITASAFLSPEGALHADVLQALAADGFVEHQPAGLVARHRASDQHSVQVGIAMERPRTAPVLVFSVGDIDLKFGFIREFADADFALPPEAGFDPAAFPGAAGGSQRVPYALVASFVGRLLAPYLRGLVVLARLGFDRIFLLPPPPPTLDDDAFATMNGFRAPAALRYKATRAFNLALRAFVRDYPEFTLLDTWDRVTAGGVLDPAYHLDDSHLNRRGALLAVEDLLRELERRAPSPPPGGTPSPRPSPAGQRFAQDGIFAIDLGAEVAQALRAAATFEPCASRGVAAVRPDADLLERCREMLCAGEVHRVVADCLGSEHARVTLRLLKTLEPADPLLGVPLLVRHDAVPSGALRGILYLTGVPETADALVFAARRGGSAQLRPGMGTLVVYDPRRVEHRESLPGAETVDLLFVPAADGGFRVVAADGEPWVLASG